jgi:hypothetical protein
MTQDVQKILEESPDFINIKRYGNSLAKLEVRYPGGCPDHIIAKALGLTEEQTETRYQQIVACLRSEMGVSFKA